MVQSFNHYTYKITFPGFPWYYYGVHTDNGKPYYGSPKTNKWMWDTYEVEIQILERFKDRREAEEVERRLIRAFIHDSNCLNCQVGGQPTREQTMKGVQTQINQKIGIFGKDKPWNDERIKKATETMQREGTGIFDREVKVKGGKIAGEKNKRSGHMQSLGKRQGRKNVESGNLNKASKLGAAAQHKQKWMCLETGYISTACGLSHYQKARGINKSQRVKL